MSDANREQVGGMHYKTGYEHWDLALHVGWDGYLPGQISKYVTRWRDKGGVTDLKKALHFLDKLIENPATWRSSPLTKAELAAVYERYVKENGLSLLESEIIGALITGPDRGTLQDIRGYLLTLIELASPPHRSDSNKHAQEETP